LGFWKSPTIQRQHNLWRMERKKENILSFSRLPAKRNFLSTQVRWERVSPTLPHLTWETGARHLK
jgi:hypothetical protein